MIGEYLEDDWISENYEHLISNIDTHDSYMWYFYDKLYICSCLTKRKCWLAASMCEWGIFIGWRCEWMGEGGGGHGMKGS